MTESDGDDLSLNEQLLVAIGVLTPEGIRERARVWRESEPLIGLPPDEWPDFVIRWDYRWTSAHHSLDGVSREEFEKDNPPGSLDLVCVPVSGARTVFCANVRREEEGIWSLGDERKLAKALLWWIEGNRMTPPYLRLMRRGAEGFAGPDCVTFNGGHHRFSICAARKLNCFPAYIAAADLDALIAKIPGTTKIDALLAGESTCC